MHGYNAELHKQVYDMCRSEDSLSDNPHPHTRLCHLDNCHKNKLLYHENHNGSLPKYEYHGHDTFLKPKYELQKSVYQFLPPTNSRKSLFVHHIENT